MAEVLVRSLTGLAEQITAGTHQLIADEPAPVGADQGPNPYELLLAALGCCTAMTAVSYTHLTLPTNREV